jgi:DNA-binding response OmpR family regulator
MRRCYELGANSYVVKPVDFRRFSSFVTNLASFWLTLNEPPP